MIGNFVSRAIAISWCFGISLSSYACAQELPVTRLRDQPGAYTLNSGITVPKELVVRDESQFEEVWQTIHRIRRPKPAMPEINFLEQSIIVVALGEIMNGGQQVTIGRVYQENGQIIVFVNRERSSAGCVSTTGAIQPVDIVIVPRIEKPVQFRTRDVMLDCK